MKNSIVLLLATEPATAIAQSAEDIAAARRLIGMWQLVDCTVTFADGTSRPDPRTTAYIFYSDTGMTCYIAMDPTRKAWKSEAAPTPEEALASLTGLSPFFGPGPRSKGRTKHKGPRTKDQAQIRK